MMQFDDSVMTGRITTQSVCPAVRSIRSTDFDPFASSVFSHPPEKLNRKPGNGSHCAFDFRAFDRRIEIQVDGRAIDDFRNLITFVVVVEGADIKGERTIQQSIF